VFAAQESLVDDRSGRTLTPSYGTAWEKVFRHSRGLDPATK